jgi:hypothetical protein
MTHRPCAVAQGVVVYTLAFMCIFPRKSAMSRTMALPFLANFIDAPKPCIRMDDLLFLHLLDLKMRRERETIKSEADKTL